MRVALVSDYYYPDLGGMPEHVHHLGRELSQRGHEVTVVTTAFPQAPPLRPVAAPPYEVVRLGRASGALIANGSVSRAAIGLGLRRQLTALFARQRPDIVHVHAPIFPTLALLAISCAPIDARLIGTLHTHFEDSQILRFFRRALQRYLDELDGIIAVSQSAIDSMRRIGFTCDGALIPNGVAMDEWSRGQQLPQFTDGRLNLLVQARLEPRNHVDTIISALRCLPAGERARVRLLVVGDGPALKQLRSESAGLEVVFLGPQLGERPNFAATSDVYCFSAAIASHPMSLLEGMASGRPVLAHDIDGVRQLVSDGVEGFVLPLREPGAYAAALSRLLHSPELRLKMGQAARRRAAEFGWERVAARVEDFYRSVLTRAQSEPRSDR